MSDTRKARRANDERKRRQAARVAVLRARILENTDCCCSHGNLEELLDELCKLAGGDVT